MIIAYLVIAFFYGIYLYQTSVWNGYQGRNAHSMRGRTIFIAMCLWPLVMIARFFTKRQ